MSVRQEIAVEAAKLISENGLLDYRTAKQKALRHLGKGTTRDLPSNKEIEDQLKIQISLFGANEQIEDLRAKRKEAIQAMKLVEQFQPRLVGTVLEGTATKTSPIEIHLFSDSVKDVAIFLMQKNIPFEPADHRVKMSKHESELIPSFEFYAGDFEIQLLVFPLKSIRQNPISPISGSPMKRASLTKVLEMIESDSDIS